jgi:hypothetical protein
MLFTTPTLEHMNALWCPLGVLTRYLRIAAQVSAMRLAFSDWRASAWTMELRVPCAASLLTLLSVVFAAQAACGPHVIGKVQPTGVFSGTVSKGPVSPTVRAGVAEPPSGVAGAQVDIATLTEKPVQSVKTDSRGAFRLSLPTGTYKVTMPSLYGAMFTRDLPATITIAPGRETRLDIHLDTGMR